MIKLPFESQKLIDICRKNDVSRIGIFGSFARGEASEESDIPALKAKILTILQAMS